MFLTRLLARTLGETDVLTPRRASRFEGSDGGFEERVGELAPPTGGPAMQGGRAPVDERPPVSRASSKEGRPSPAPPPAAVTEGERQLPPTREVHEVRTQEQRQAPFATAPPPLVMAQRNEVPPPPQPAAQPRRTHVRPANAAPEHAAPAGTETRIEHHSIERRFETLVREHTTERIREITPPEQRPGKPSIPDRPHAPARAVVSPSIAPRLAPAAPSRRTALAEGTGPAPSAAVEPVVHVTIGRVEVRAVQASAAKPATTRPREPRMGLDDYLARRERR